MGVMNGRPEQTETFWTASGVRLRAARSGPGELNWLFLPGGPGIGSESLAGLVDAIDVPGTCWLVDLPGDGSNVDAPGANADPFSAWPQVLIEAAQAVSNPIYVGHSTGGMYLLSTPALEEVLSGLVLVSTAPNASWLPTFVAMTEANPLPAVATATAHYEANPTDFNLGRIAVASAQWNFSAGFVEAGAQFLERMPYNGAAVDWSDKNFDHTYESTWWPDQLPTLIISGSDDRIVDQSLWDTARFKGAHVLRRIIDGGAHFAWMENPGAVREAFSDFAARIVDTGLE